MNETGPSTRFWIVPDDLVRVLTHYLQLRKMGEHGLALYYMSMKDDLVRDAARRHTKNIKDRFYWCEREFCGFQISKDRIAYTGAKNEGYVVFYARNGYVPAASVYVAAYCGHLNYAEGGYSDEILKSIYDKARDGDKFSRYAFVKSLAQHSDIQPQNDTHLRQTCSPWMNIADIGQHLLPGLREFSQKPPFFDDFLPLISAIEHDLEANDISARYIRQLNAMQAKLSAKEEIHSSDLDLLKRIVDNEIEETFYKKDKVSGMARNLYGLLSYYGIGLEEDQALAVELWFDVAKENKYYSVSSIFNLLGHKARLNAEQLEFLLYNVDTDMMNQEESVAYATYLIDQDAFENVSDNPLNRRATWAIFNYIDSNQRRGTGRAPANATPAQKLYEYLSAEYIAKTEAETAALIAAVVAGLAIIGAASGPSSAPVTSSPPDSCAGINGLGWYNNSLGNAAALFGCRKY